MYWKHLGKKKSIYIVHNLQVLQVVSSCQKEHVTKVTISLVSSHVRCQKCWSSLTQTLELFQVFCDATTTDKSIITRISALNRNTLTPACFTSPALQRGAGETASHAAAQVHHQVKGVQSAGTAVWSHHCPPALPGHQQGPSSHPELPQDGPNTSCLNPAGTQGSPATCPRPRWDGRRHGKKVNPLS